MRGERGGRGVVEDQCRAEPEPGGGVEPVAELHRREGVEADVPERPVGTTVAAPSCPSTAAACVRTSSSRASSRSASPSPASRWASECSTEIGPAAAVRRAGVRARSRSSGGTPSGRAGQCSRVHPHRDHRGLAARTDRVQQGQLPRRRTALQAEPLDAAQGRLVELVPHAAVAGPQAPGHRGGRHRRAPAGARPARPGRRWPPRSCPGPRCPGSRRRRRTARTPTGPGPRSARAGTRPRPPSDAARRRSAPASATRSRRRR